MPDIPEDRIRVYLAGAMTGMPELNEPQFDEWAQVLRQYGYEVMSPPEFPHNDDIEPGMPREDVYRVVIPKDIAILYTCDVICLMPGWQYSPGAGLESHASSLPRIVPIEAPDPHSAAVAIQHIMTARLIWEKDDRGDDRR